MPMDKDKKALEPNMSKQTVCLRLHQTGFTLIELLISIVILSIAILGLISIFMTISVGSVRGEFRVTAAMIAQEQIEKMKSRGFDELASKDVNGNWSEALGVDAGENAADDTTFDDVDDYNGWVEALAAPYNGFTRTVEVCYVLETAVDACLVIPGPVPNDWTPDHKRVRVTVTNNGVPFAELITLIGQVRT